MHLVNNIDFSNGALGGLILGTTTMAHFYVNKSVSGISGITSSFSNISNGFYFSGLLTAGALLKKIKPEVFESSLIVLSDSTSLQTYYIIGGFLVGFGTRLGNGCTSGHGLCGLGRMSPRSLAAVLTFMTSGAITSYIANETNLLPFLTNSLSNKDLINNNSTIYISSLSLLSSIFFLNALPYLLNKNQKLSEKFNFTNIKDYFLKNYDNKNVKNYFFNYLLGIVFGFGLGISGMCNTDRVIKFLNFTSNSGWDPTLMSVLGVGCAITASGFYFFNNKINNDIKKEDSNSEICMKDYKLNYGVCKPNLIIDKKLIIGSLIFGIGWGLCGICPGPGIVSAGANIESSKLFLTSLIFGMSSYEIFQYFFN